MEAAPRPTNMSICCTFRWLITPRDVGRHQMHHQVLEVPDADTTPSSRTWTTYLDARIRYDAMPAPAVQEVTNQHAAAILILDGIVRLVAGRTTVFVVALVFQQATRLAWGSTVLRVRAPVPVACAAARRFFHRNIIPQQTHQGNCESCELCPLLGVVRCRLQTRSKPCRSSVRRPTPVLPPPHPPRQAFREPQDRMQLLFKNGSAIV